VFSITFQKLRIFINMRKKMNPKDKKVTIAVSINPILDQKLNELYTNKSKHIEWLVYQYLLKNNHIQEMPL